ncbi:unnamed protein product [Symbiodinium sp. CCMP2592]|nr:unnamed protein product [Symbiodinium sp. CCMP2592]
MRSRRRTCHLERSLARGRGAEENMPPGEDLSTRGQHGECCPFCADRERRGTPARRLWRGRSWGGHADGYDEPDGPDAAADEGTSNKEMAEYHKSSLAQQKEQNDRMFELWAASAASSSAAPAAGQLPPRARVAAVKLEDGKLPYSPLFLEAAPGQVDSVILETACLSCARPWLNSERRPQQLRRPLHPTARGGRSSFVVRCTGSRPAPTASTCGGGEVGGREAALLTTFSGSGTGAGRHCHPGNLVLVGQSRPLYLSDHVRQQLDKLCCPLSCYPLLLPIAAVHLLSTSCPLSAHFLLESAQFCPMSLLTSTCFCLCSAHPSAHFLLPTSAAHCSCPPSAVCRTLSAADFLLKLLSTRCLLFTFCQLLPIAAVRFCPVLLPAFCCPPSLSI